MMPQPTKVTAPLLLSQIEKVSIVEAKPGGQHSSESHALGGRTPNDDGCDFILVTVPDGEACVDLRKTTDQYTRLLSMPLLCIRFLFPRRQGMFA